MRKLSKILALVLVLMMAFAVLSAFNFTTSAANIPAGTVLYLVPSANWNQSNARFAAYFFGSGEAWVSMTKVEGQSNLYQVTVPAGSWTNVIFCRMNPANTSNSWNTKWNQTADLTYNGTSNCYTVKEGTWDKGGGTWSTYGNACTHKNVGAAATCTTAQVCLDCGDPVVSALGHTYNSTHLCTRCNGQATFTVAGTGAHLGTEWDTGNTANDMTYADGVYTKVYTNVAAGSYLLKVARDHDWGTSYPGSDKAYTVSKAGSTVTVTLKGTTVTVTVEAPHVCNFVAGEVVPPTFESEGYTVYTCTCGKTENRDSVPALVAVATADGDKYTSLEEALENGSEIVLLADIKLDAPIVITGSYTIDLNGFTLSYESDVMGEAMITNKGTLVINDSVGTGVINYNYVGAADASYGKGNYTISNAGTLTVNGGEITIAVLRSHAKYPIDNNSTTGDAILVINGGHLYNYNTSAIRMFCNSTTYKNSVTINGGVVEGYCAVWVQNPGNKTVNADLTITGGEIRTTAAAWVNGTAALKDVSSALYFTIAGNGGAWSEASFVAITGGTFNENVYLADSAPANISVGEGATFNGYLELPHTHSWSDATCTEPSKCSCGETQGEALGHTYENCVCTGCQAVLPTLGATDSFDLTNQANFDAAVASGKLAFVDSFRNNGDSFQFNEKSTIQFVAPANSTVTIVGHSAQYGVFNVYLNGEKTVMEGSLTFTVTEETKVVIAVGDNGASYSYIKSISLVEYVDRTITSDTTINFGSEGNYKDSIVDFSGIKIGDNGGNNSQVKEGSFDLLLKAGSKVVIHGYNGYTSYKLNNGEEITSEWYTYIALEDMVLTVTPVSGNNYFYSIEVTLHTGVTLVEAKNATCTEAGYEAYYSCECHGELTDKAEVKALGHTAGADATCTAAQTCTVCGVELAEKLAHEWADATCTAPKTCTVCNATEGEALGHKFFAGVCTVCEVADPDYNAYVLNFSQWPEFPKETYADGDIFKYNDIFTFIMGKNSRVDASAKTWEDFEGTLRFSFGGKTPTGAVPSKNALQITVDDAYTIKIWYVAGGDARYFALMDAEGTVLSETTKETVKNGQYYDELVIPAAGTYYLGVPGDNNYIFQIELVKHEHTAGAEATCTTAQTCTVCGAELKAALGHTAGAEATCTTAQTCTVCGAELVAALGHTPGADATCAAAQTCTVCGVELAEKLAHTFADATCTAPKTCTVCGATEGEALGHNYYYNLCLTCYAPNPEFINNYTTVGENTLVCNKWHLVENEGGHGKPYQFTFMTIPEDGFYIFTTNSNLSVFIYTIPYDASDVEGWATGGPNWAVFTYGQAELKAGTYYLGFIFLDGEGEYDLTITKHDHTEEVVAGKDATCTEAGLTEGKKCSVCGTVLVKQEEIPATGHEYVDGVCHCGAEEPKVEPPVEEPKAEELNFFQKIIAWIVELFNKFIALFKKN